MHQGGTTFFLLELTPHKYHTLDFVDFVDNLLSIRADI